jgi:peptidyl-prolyl cis-trans isomerase A (cyclophilin A)
VSGRASLALAVLSLASCTPAPTAGGIGDDPAPTAVTIPSAAPAPSGSVPWLTPMPTGVAFAYDAGVLRGDASTTPPPTGTIVKTGGDDPLAGRFSLAEATRDLKGTGALVARIDTARGPLECKLYEDKAPHTVANFVGLARGIRPWKNAQNQWMKKAAYDGTSFHRIVRGFMIQGGDPIGDGVGDVGYVIDDEVWPGATHDRAGLLCMANRGKNTNAAQFFITDGAALHLDSKGYTIFGECSPLSRVHELAGWPVSGDKALSPPAITAISILRRTP